MGLKKILINFGLDIVIGKAFSLLSEKKAYIITWLEDQAISLINKNVDPQDLGKMADNPKDAAELVECAKLVKDGGVFFLRSIIFLLVHLLLFQANSLKARLVKAIKL